MNRSFLFVPADSERKLQKALASGADALILDLEDSVSADARPMARSNIAAFPTDEFDGEVWVRINPLDTADATDDLRAAVPTAPQGIVLPKPIGARDSVQLGKLLDVLEHESGLEQGAIGIIPIATERPGALLQMQDYAVGIPRLTGIAWGAEDLSAALGASANRDDAGAWLAPYQLARSLCLLAATAAGVAAIDTVYTDFKDEDGLLRFAASARRDGFESMLAIHPAQVPIINAAFKPTQSEIQRANAIVALFAENPNAGVVALDGEMVDRPHLRQAERILSKAVRVET